MPSVPAARPCPHPLAQTFCPSLLCSASSWEWHFVRMKARAGPVWGGRCGKWQAWQRKRQSWKGEKQQQIRARGTQGRLKEMRILPDIWWGEKEGVLMVEFSPVFRAGLGLSLWILKERASPKGRRSWGTPRGILWAC